MTEAVYIFSFSCSAGTKPLENHCCVCDPCTYTDCTSNGGSASPHVYRHSNHQGNLTAQHPVFMSILI